MPAKNIFLSASVPLEERDHKYFESADVIAIRDSVIALASSVLANQSYHLIWGGHPSITPFITLVLDHYGLKMSNRVTFYQSYEFEDKFPPENEDVGIRIYTDKKENRDASLLEMRQHMLGDNDFAAAVFVGGMEGVEDEYALFRQFHPDVPCLPIASTGAAARLLYDEHPGEFDTRLLSEMSYTSLFKELLDL